MRHKNANTSALTAALQSDLPTLKAEAEKLLKAAEKKHGTFVEQADSLGINVRALHRIRALLRGE